MSDYVRDLLRMATGNNAAGRDNMLVPDEIMDALSGDAAQEAMMKERLLTEMRKHDGRADPRFVSLDLMEMEADHVDDFLKKARGRIIKRSKHEREACCKRIGGVLQQMLGPAGDEWLDQKAPHDRGDEDPIGEDSVDEMCGAPHMRFMKQKRKRKGVHAPKDVEEAVLSEKWGKETEVDPREKGKYKGRSLESLKSEYEALKAKSEKAGGFKKGSKNFGKMKELAFAIRAKTGWGRLGEALEEALSDEHKKVYAFRKGESRDVRAKRIAHYKKTGQVEDVELLTFIAEEFELFEHDDDCLFAQWLEEQPQVGNNPMTAKDGEEETQGADQMAAAAGEPVPRKPVVQTTPQPPQSPEQQQAQAQQQQQPQAAPSAQAPQQGAPQQGEQQPPEQAPEEQPQQQAPPQPAPAPQPKQPQMADVEVTGDYVVSETAKALVGFTEAMGYGQNYEKGGYARKGYRKPPQGIPAPGHPKEETKKNAPYNDAYNTMPVPVRQGLGKEAGKPGSLQTRGKDVGDPIGEADASQTMGPDEGAAFAAEMRKRRRDQSRGMHDLPKGRVEHPGSASRDPMQARGPSMMQKSDVDYAGPQISETAHALAGFMEAVITDPKRKVGFPQTVETRPDNTKDYVKTGQDPMKGHYPPEEKPRFDKGADPRGDATKKQLSRP